MSQSSFRPNPSPCITGMGECQISRRPRRSQLERFRLIPDTYWESCGARSVDTSTLDRWQFIAAPLPRPR